MATKNRSRISASTKAGSGSSGGTHDLISSGDANKSRNPTTVPFSNPLIELLSMSEYDKRIQYRFLKSSATSFKFGENMFYRFDALTANNPDWLSTITVGQWVAAYRHIYDYSFRVSQGLLGALGNSNSYTWHQLIWSKLPFGTTTPLIISRIMSVHNASRIANIDTPTRLGILIWLYSCTVNAILRRPHLELTQSSIWTWFCFFQFHFFAHYDKPYRLPPPDSEYQFYGFQPGSHTCYDSFGLSVLHLWAAVQLQLNSNEIPETLPLGIYGDGRCTPCFLPQQSTPDHFKPEVDNPNNNTRDVEDITFQASMKKLQNLSTRIRTITGKPIARGGYGDIWQGQYDDGTQVSVVGIKVLRAGSMDSAKIKRVCSRLIQEAHIWSLLQHPNVLSFIGYSTDFGPLPAMISPWMNNGNLPSYLKARPTDIKPEKRLYLLVQVAKGLEYLHGRTPPIVHGDLTGRNILVNDLEEACLCDFGLSCVRSEIEGDQQTTIFAGSTRWMAPELFESDEEGNPLPTSLATDVYSFGCVIHEVLTDCVPFHHVLNDAQVIVKVSEGARPPKPDSLPEEFTAAWRLAEECWESNAELRPDASRFIEYLLR